MHRTPSASELPTSFNEVHPSNLRVQSALISAQICFGLGAVISALGLPACNPFAFALYREIAAGSILLAASAYLSSPNDPPTLSVFRDWRRFTLLGLTLFGNQACVIAGIKLAGPVASAVWQPSQPIMTAAISMMLGWEAASFRRILGVVLSFLGCAAMVILSTKEVHNGDIDGEENATNESSSNRTVKELVGHALFFSNCLCTSLYVLLSKAPLKVYRPMQVTAWSYTIAAAFMATLANLISFSNSLVAFLCPDCVGTWYIPKGAAFALAYAIVFNSVIAYFLITWANIHATGTLVIGYSVLQPVVAALLTMLLLGIGMFPSCVSLDGKSGDDNGTDENGSAASACLDAPGWGAMLGMMGVFGGLALTISTEPNAKIGEMGKQGQYEKVDVKDEGRSPRERPFGDVELT